MSLLRFMKISADEVDLAVHAYVDQITAVSMPTAIYVFGSMASGQASVESDIDLLVIYPDEATARAAQTAVLRLKCPCSVAADIIFIDVAAWWQRRRYSPLIETVQTEGKLVYGAAPLRREATQ
ncbi:MAG: nucleotidyltransferase domain-containing protein [Deltaproteobacteria bacterium]|nr:nucleotidyltransferase domain-containing protein [Deltaproteobacteria bacterium]